MRLLSIMDNDNNNNNLELSAMTMSTSMTTSMSMTMTQLVKPVYVSSTHETDKKASTMEKVGLVSVKAVPLIIFCVPIPGSFIVSVIVGYGMSRFTKKIDQRETVIDHLRHCISPISKTLPIYFNRGLLSFFKKIPPDWNLENGTELESEINIDDDTGTSTNTHTHTHSHSHKYKIKPQQLAMLLNWADQTKLIKDESGNIKSIEQIILMVVDGQLVNTLKVTDLELYNFIFKDYTNETDPMLRFYAGLCEIVDNYIIYLSKYYQESKPDIMMKMNALRLQSLIDYNTRLSATKDLEISNLKKICRFETESQPNKQHLKLLRSELKQLESQRKDLIKQLQPLRQTQRANETASGRLTNCWSLTVKFFSPRSRKSVYALSKNDHEYKKQRYIVADEFLKKLENIAKKIDDINSPEKYEELEEIDDIDKQLDKHLNELATCLEDLAKIANTESN